MTSPKIETGRPQVYTPHPRGIREESLSRGKREMQLNSSLFHTGRSPFSPGIISPRDQESPPPSSNLLASLMPPSRDLADSTSPEPFPDVEAPLSPTSSQNEDEAQDFSREYRTRFSQLEIKGGKVREISTPETYVYKALELTTEESSLQQKTAANKTNSAWLCKTCNRVFTNKLNAYGHFFCTASIKV